MPIPDLVYIDTWLTCAAAHVGFLDLQAKTHRNTLQYMVKDVYTLCLDTNFDLELSVPCSQLAEASSPKICPFA